MEKMRIAVIGSGISGLSAAWLLSKRHKVTLYETNNYTGGHANTVDVDLPEGKIAVDTGFIVYNEANYPNLTALYKHLNVATDPTEMTFTLSANQGSYEYSGTGINGLFGQRRNLLKKHHWRLLTDLTRFFRHVQKQITQHAHDISLGDFLKKEGYSQVFIQDHIVPMGAAIWSTNMTEMLRYPARSFIDFYANHGLLELISRPHWRTVSGGSRSYVDRMVEDGGFEILHNDPVRRITRHPDYVHITDGRGTERPFDHVVIATHADQALALLDTPSALEKQLLSPFTYQDNTAILHHDTRWMPKRKRLWSSWNYLKRDDAENADLCVTYWMNRLQNLGAKTNLFVTLNPYDDIHPKAIAASFTYQHPVFNAKTAIAQKNLGALQGNNRTWFCGSYFGYGFHEDGAQSGLAIAEQLGNVKRPWTVKPSDNRISLPEINTQAAE